MRIVILDDDSNAFRGSSAFARLKDHEVVVYRDTVKDPEAAPRVGSAQQAPVRFERAGRYPGTARLIASQ